MTEECLVDFTSHTLAAETAVNTEVPSGVGGGNSSSCARVPVCEKAAGGLHITCSRYLLTNYLG